MITRNASRRAFLQAIGLSSAFVPLFPSDPVRAAGKARRLVVFQWPNGVRSEYWPSGSGPGFELTPVMSALAPHKQDLLIIDGLDNRVLMDQYPTYGGHSALAYLLTGARAAGKMGNDISIDQFVANKFQAESASELHSLILGVDNREERAADFKYLSFSGPAKDGKPNAPPVLDDVNAVYKKLFTGVVPGSNGGGMPGPQVDRLRWERKSIWDHVHKDVDRFVARMGQDGKERLGAYAQAVREIEMQLDAIPAGTPVNEGPVKCEAPADATGLDSYSKRNYDKILKVQIEMVAAALGCGKTRVATIHASNSHNNSWVFHWLGDAYSKPADSREKFNDLVCHHQIAHLGSGGDATWAALKNGVDRWFTGQYAYLLDRLKYHGVLSSTLAVMINCMGNGGAHSNTRLPVILAGGGGYFKTGQLVKAGGKPHNGLLIAIAHAAGYPVETFGDPKYPGHLPGLT